MKNVVLHTSGLFVCKTLKPEVINVQENQYLESLSSFLLNFSKT